MCLLSAKGSGKKKCVYVVGGGAPLIYDSIKTAWHHLGQKVVMMESPQTALVEAIAAFKEE